MLKSFGEIGASYSLFWHLATFCVCVFPKLLHRIALLIGLDFQWDLKKTGCQRVKQFVSKLVSKTKQNIVKKKKKNIVKKLGIKIVMQKNFGLYAFPFQYRFFIYLFILHNTCFFITLSFLMNEVSISFSRRLLFTLVAQLVQKPFCNTVILKLSLFYCPSCFDLRTLKLYK